MNGVLVLGAGLAGLGCARELPGCRIFEAKAYSGGHSFSHELGGVAFDEGAHICHSKDPAYRQLIYSASGAVTETPASRVANYWRGQWVTYPVQNNLAQLPEEIRVRALTDFVIAQQEQRSGGGKSYEEWCQAQYGKFLTDEFYAVYTRKYWRVPMSEMATDWLPGRLIPTQIERVIRGALTGKGDDQATFSSFAYPSRGGYFSFYQRLYEGLPVEHGRRAVSVDPQRKTVQFSDGRTEHYEWLATSIPLPELVGMLANSPGFLREAAAVLRHTQLLCVNLIVNRPKLVDYHWFYIYDEEVDAARVSVPSNFSECDPDITALQAEIFRLPHEPMNDRELVDRTIQQLARLLGFSIEKDVKAVASVRVPYAYVISDHRRERAVTVIKSWLEQQGIHSMGLYGGWKFIWSDAAIRSGAETARVILKEAGREKI